ncbi:MAG: hypothetical protein IKS83_02560 [Victivallales bacterium]|nr:hypothetical protein [Victivallales bacterium]
MPAAQLTAVHDTEQGITHLAVTDADPDRQYLIYRSSEELTEEDFDQANVVATGLKGERLSCEFVANANGTFHYALASTDNLGRKLHFEDATSVQETDRTPPTPPQPTLRYEDGVPILEWQGPSIENPEGIRRYRIYRADTTSTQSLLAEIKKARTPEQSYRDENWGDNVNDYTVTAVDRSGLESVHSKVLSAHKAPDLGMPDGDRVSTNPALATSKMYPVPGETVQFTATITNYGAVVSSPCRVTVTCGEETLPDINMPVLAAGATHTIAWEHTITQPGKYETVIQIDPDEQSGDWNPENNKLVFHAAAAERDIYFLWYGEVPHLPYSNTSQCIPESIAECHRRGAYAMRGVGISENTAEDAYDAFPQLGYDGFSVDEIFRFTGPAPHLAEILPAFRERNPDTLVCVWTIGTEAAPEIVELVKSGVIDFLLFEVYVKPGEDTAPLRKAIENFRSYGIIDHCIMGLVTDQTWSNWTSPEVQRDSILEQMRLVRQLAPESPGFAFWSANTQPGVAEAVDQECYHLFLEISN